MKARWGNLEQECSFYKADSINFNQCLAGALWIDILQMSIPYDMHGVLDWEASSISLPVGTEGLLISTVMASPESLSAPGLLPMSQG